MQVSASPERLAQATRRRAIGLLLGGLFFLICLDACGKLLGEMGVPVAASTWSRYFGHFLLMLMLVYPRQGLSALRPQYPRLQWARGLMMVLITLLYFAALRIMPFAEATAVFFLTPIFTTLLTMRLLHERPGRWTWMAIALGFIGVLIVLRPGTSLPWQGVLLVIAAALANAAYQTMTRASSAQGRRESIAVQLTYSALPGALLMSLAAPWWLELEWLSAMSLRGWGVFAAAGLLGAAGHGLLIRAYSLVPAHVVTPWAYLQLLFSIVLGMLLFGTVPDAATLFGMVVIGLAPQLARFDQRR